MLSARGLALGRQEKSVWFSLGMAKAWNRRIAPPSYPEGETNVRNPCVSGDRSASDLHPTAFPHWEVGGKTICSGGWRVEG